MLVPVPLLAAYLLSAMNSMYPQRNHAFHENHSITEARYEIFAEDVAKVVLDPEQKPLFGGEDGRVKTGLLLISIASTESMFIDAVMTCKNTGDNGASWGPFQTQRDHDSSCGGTQSAARVAIGMIRESFQVCKDLPELDHLAEYTDGNAYETPRAARRSEYRMSRAKLFFVKHPFTVESQEELSLVGM